MRENVKFFEDLFSVLLPLSLLSLDILCHTDRTEHGQTFFFFYVSVFFPSVGVFFSSALLIFLSSQLLPFCSSSSLRLCGEFLR
jgi:hypothetical protein